MWGDYYNSQGQWLENDVKDDHKVYHQTQVLTPTIGFVDEFQVTDHLETVNIELKGVTTEDLIDIAAIANGESSGNKEETFAFANAIKNNMDQSGQTESQATRGSFSYAKKKNEPGYRSLKNATDGQRNGTRMQTAIAGALNALTGGTDYSNGSKGWDGTDVLSGSSNGVGGHNLPENHYRQRNGGISDPMGLANSFYENSRTFIGQKFGVNGREYRAVKPLVIGNTVAGKSVYEVTASHGASISYDHR